MRKFGLVGLLLVIASTAVFSQVQMGHMGYKVSAFPKILYGDDCPFRPEGDTNGDGILESAFYNTSFQIHSIDHAGDIQSIVGSGQPTQFMAGYYDFDCDGRDEMLVGDYIYTRPLDDPNMIEYAYVASVKIWFDQTSGYSGLARTGDWDCDGCDEVIFKEDANQGYIKIVGDEGVENFFSGSYNGAGFWDVTGDGVVMLQSELEFSSKRVSITQGGKHDDIQT